MAKVSQSETRRELKQEIFEGVCNQLAMVSASGAGPRLFDESTELIGDLGLNSLKFVDLTVALEDALQIDEFPMQEWIDAQLAADRPLTVGELASACHALVLQARATTRTL